MHWLIHDIIKHEPKWNELIEILEKYNLSFSIHKVVPFSGEICPKLDVETKNVFCMGSYSLRHLSKKNNWYPGVINLDEIVNFEEMKKCWGKFFLNDDSKIYKFKDVKFSGFKFIRPVEDTKAFSGTVFSSNEFHEWQEKIKEIPIEGTDLNNETLVQVSSVKTIAKEFRFWIVDNRISTHSLYKEGDRVLYQNRVDEYVKKFVLGLISPISVNFFEPAKAYVLDVCQTIDGNLKIVELNNINSAGLYDCDVSKLIMNLNGFFSKNNS